MKLYIDLMKAILDRGHLIRKLVEVKKQNGNTFRRWQWVLPEDYSHKEYDHQIQPYDEEKHAEYHNQTQEHDRDNDDIMSPKQMERSQPLWNNARSSLKKFKNAIGEQHTKKRIGKYNLNLGDKDSVHRIGLSSAQMKVMRFAENCVNPEHTQHLEHTFFAYLQSQYPDDSHKDLVDKMNHFKDICQHAPITINFDPFGSIKSKNKNETTLDGLMKSGEYRAMNLEDADEDHSTYVESRIEAEDFFFDMGHDAPDYERPVYGALNILGNESGAASAYGGGVHFILKPHVKHRCTLTTQDTFCLVEDNHNALFPGTKGYLAAIGAVMDDMEYEGKYVINKITGEAPTYKYDTLGDERIMPNYTGYIEAQIFGGIKLSDDVEAIVIPEDWADTKSSGLFWDMTTGQKQERLDKIKALADKYEFPIRTIKHPEKVEYEKKLEEERIKREKDKAQGIEKPKAPDIDFDFDENIPLGTFDLDDLL